MPSIPAYGMLRFEDVCVVQMIVTGEFGGFRNETYSIISS